MHEHSEPDALRCRSAAHGNGRRPALISTIAFAGLLAGALSGLTGCDKLPTNGGSNTMTLLRSGAEKVCVAAEVRQTLHDLIIPKVDAVGGSASNEDKLQAARGVSLSYDMTTLQSFDKAVSKATCNATVTVSGADNQSSKFDINYIVSPSADDPNAFVVSASSSDAKAYARSLILDAAQQLDTNRQDQAQAAEESQAKALVLATVSPRWMVGTWIRASADASNCATDTALTMTADRTFSGGGFNGRWALNQDQLHLVGSGPDGPVDDVNVITQADTISFTETANNGDTVQWRRCARNEVEAPASDGQPQPTNTAADPE